MPRVRKIAFNAIAITLVHNSPSHQKTIMKIDLGVFSVLCYAFGHDALANAYNASWVAVVPYDVDAFIVQVFKF